jgi:hypothetical protein
LRRGRDRAQAIDARDVSDEIDELRSPADVPLCHCACNASPSFAHAPRQGCAGAGSIGSALASAAVGGPG